MFKRIPSRARQEALDVIGQVREGKFAQRVKQAKKVGLTYYIYRRSGTRGS